MFRLTSRVGTVPSTLFCVRTAYGCMYFIEIEVYYMLLFTAVHLLPLPTYSGLCMCVV